MVNSSTILPTTTTHKSFTSYFTPQSILSFSLFLSALCLLVYWSSFFISESHISSTSTSSSPISTHSSHSVFTMSTPSNPLPSPMSYPSERVIIGHKQPVPNGWTDKGSVVHTEGIKSIKDERIDFVIFLKQQNLDKLQKTLKDVSDPKSGHYGDYLSKDEVGQMVNPPIQRQQAALDWVNSCADVLDAGIQPLGDSIKVDHAKIEGIMKLLQTGEFHLYTNDKNEHTYICEQVSVPSPLADVVSMVHPLVSFPIAHAPRPHPRPNPIKNPLHGEHPTHAGHIVQPVAGEGQQGHGLKQGPFPPSATNTDDSSQQSKGHGLQQGPFPPNDNTNPSGHGLKQGPFPPAEKEKEKDNVGHGLKQGPFPPSTTGQESQQPKGHGLKQGPFPPSQLQGQGQGHGINQGPHIPEDVEQDKQNNLNQANIDLSKPSPFITLRTPEEMQRIYNSMAPDTQARERQQ